MPGRFLVILPDLFDLDHGLEQLADVVGQLGIAVDVLLKRRALAGPVARGKPFGQPGQQHVVGGAVRNFVSHLPIFPAWGRGRP